MIRLAAEAFLSLTSLYKALTFKKDWQSGLDVSTRGLWHSFAAALICLPFFLLILSGGSRIGLTEQVAPFWWHFLLSWPVFLIVAGLITRVVGATERFTPWVVMHNWGVVWLYGLLAVMWSLQIAGLINVTTLGVLLVFVYDYVRLLVHWRIAYLALGTPTITSALIAAVPILVSEILGVGLIRIYGAGG